MLVCWVGTVSSRAVMQCLAGGIKQAAASAILGRTWEFRISNFADIAT